MDSLWYEQPAERWLEALPVGNGRLGAMVFGGRTEERIALNCDTLWSGSPRGSGITGGPETLAELRRLLVAEDDRVGAGAAARRLQGPDTESYQPAGDLVLTHNSPAGSTGYRRSLDLARGVAGVRTGGVLREVFASHPDQVLVVRLTADEPGALDLTVRLETPHLRREFSHPDPATLALLSQAPAHVGPRSGVQYEAGRGMGYVVAVRAGSPDGTVSSADGALRVRGASSVTLVLAIETGFRGWRTEPESEPAPLLGRALDGVSVPMDGLMERHIADHGALFSRSSLTLDGRAPRLPTDQRLAAYRRGAADPALEALMFAYGRYLLIASSRPGSQAAHLQGIWNDRIQPAWNSDYTTNINVQMNYWPAEATGLADCHQPLFDLIGDLAESGAATAREVYGCGGWTTHHNTDLWRTSWAVGGGHDDPVWSMWPMAGGWLCHHLLEHAEFTPDPAFLTERAAPLLRGAAEFFLDYLVPDAGGDQLACISASPENAFLTADGTSASLDTATGLDLSLLRELFTACLDLHPDLGDQLKEALARLPAPGIGSDGRLREWSRELPEAEPGHRHLSHLYGLYPGDQIDVQRTPELAAAARRSLVARLEAGGGSTGWSRAWALCLWARLGEGESAEQSLRTLITEYTAVSLLDLHPPEIFQLDGNLGLTAGVAELLLQSQAGSLRLLPALPPSWRGGEVRGLRGRGGLVADLTWSQGQLTSARLVSRVDRTVVLSLPPGTPGPREVVLAAGQPQTVSFGG